MFDRLIEILKANPRKIVFTEGPDARILEAADRLKKGGFLTPILIGAPEEVKAAAAKGGFTGVCAMPNTDPVTDNGTVVEFVKSRAAEVGHCRVYPSGAMTRGLKGEAMSEMGDMVAHGAVAFTDDGRGVQGAGMLRRCMDYGKMFGKVFMSHCQDEDLVGHGQINEGKVIIKTMDELEEMANG